MVQGSSNKKSPALETSTTKKSDSKKPKIDITPIKSANGKKATPIDVKTPVGPAILTTPSLKSK